MTIFHQSSTDPDERLSRQMAFARRQYMAKHFSPAAPSGGHARARPRVRDPLGSPRSRPGQPPPTCLRTLRARDAPRARAAPVRLPFSPEAAHYDVRCATNKVPSTAETIEHSNLAGMRDEMICHTEIDAAAMSSITIQPPILTFGYGKQQDRDVGVWCMKPVIDDEVHIVRQVLAQRFYGLVESVWSHEERRDSVFLKQDTPVDVCAEHSCARQMMTKCSE